MTDRDRDRSRYSSSYVPRDRERDRDERSWQMYNDNQSRLSPAEPGQIIPLPRRPVREWEVERDPRVPPTVGSASGGGGEAGPSRRRRSSSGEEQDGSKDVALALESFSRCMHSTLLATTAQALAARNTERLESFPQNQVNPDTLSESRARLDDANSVLAEKMRSLHSAFTEVMRRAAPRNQGGSHQRRDSRNAVEDRQEVQRMIRDKVDFAELASVRKRLEGVERQLDEEAEVRKDKGKGKEREPEPTPAPAPAPSEEAQAKRSRAREMLDDMLRRLEKVEGMKEYLENRYFDIQDQLNAKEQEELEVLRLGNGRWKVIEQLRDPDGVIRGLKRRKVQEEEEEDMVIDLGSEKDVQIVSAIAEPAKTADTTSTSTSGPAPTPLPPPPPTSDDTVQALRTQVESLQKELTALKEGQAARDKAIADQVMATINTQLDGMVRSRIMKAVDVVKAQGSLSKPGQRSMTSPAVASPSLPTIPQNAVLPSPTVPQQTTPGSSTATASRPASSSSAPQAPQQVRSTSNPQPRSANASPQIPNRQTQPSPSLPTQPPPRPASHPVGDSAAPQVTGSGQARAGRDQFHVNIPPPPHFGFSHTPPQPPHSAPPAPNPLNRLIDSHSQPHQSLPPNPYQSYNQPQGLGIQHNGQPSLSNSAQLMAFQALVNNGGQNGYRAPQPPPPPSVTDHGGNGGGNGSLVQKMSNVLGAQNQGSYQGDGFQAWSIYPQPGPGQ